MLKRIYFVIVLFLLSCQPNTKDLETTLSGTWIRKASNDTLIIGNSNFKDGYYYVLQTDSGRFKHTIKGDSLYSIERVEKFKVFQFDFENDSSILINQLNYFPLESRLEIIDDDFYFDRIKILNDCDSFYSIKIIPGHLIMPFEATLIVYTDSLVLDEGENDAVFIKLNKN